MVSARAGEDHSWLGPGKRTVGSQRAVRRRGEPGRDDLDRQRPAAPSFRERWWL